VFSVAAPACAGAVGGIFRRMPHDRGRRSQPNPDPTPLAGKSALGGYAPDNIFRG
jgi:hypothetical protein